jgi:ketosteroid isomerase-like protein
LDSSWIKAVRANDLEAVRETYAPDAVVWLPQFKEARGEKAIRATFEGIAVRKHCQGDRFVGNGV